MQEFHDIHVLLVHGRNNKPSRAKRNHLAHCSEPKEANFREKGHMNLPASMSLQTADKRILTSRESLNQEGGDAPTELAAELQHESELFLKRKETFKRNHDKWLYCSYRQARFELVKQSKKSCWHPVIEEKCSKLCSLLNWNALLSKCS